MHEDRSPFIVHVPNDGRWYRVGTLVNVVRTPEFDLVPERGGRYRVESCTYVAGPSTRGMLQVELRDIRLYP